MMKYNIWFSDRLKLSLKLSKNRPIYHFGKGTVANQLLFRALALVFTGFLRMQINVDLACMRSQSSFSNQLNYAIFNTKV